MDRARARNGTKAHKTHSESFFETAYTFETRAHFCVRILGAKLAVCANALKVVPQQLETQNRIQLRWHSCFSRTAVTVRECYSAWQRVVVKRFFTQYSPIPPSIRHLFPGIILHPPARSILNCSICLPYRRGVSSPNAMNIIWRWFDFPNEVTQ